MVSLHLQQVLWYLRTTFKAVTTIHEKFLQFDWLRAVVFSIASSPLLGYFSCDSLRIFLSHRNLTWKSIQSRMETMRLCMLFKLHYGPVVADGMPHLIPMRRARRPLNANAYEVSCSRTIYHEFSFFPRTIRE